jgi:hypothetical protein
LCNNAIGYPSTEKLPALQLARAKLYTALRFLNSIPLGAAVYEAARMPITTHTQDYQNLQSIIEKLKACDSSRPASCIMYDFVSISSSFEDGIN